MRSTGLLAALVSMLAASTALAQTSDTYLHPQPRSTELAYGLAIGGTLGPMYIAKAMNERSSRQAMVAVMGAGLCWGPSLGFGYARAWKTAALSGLAKSALLGGALLLDQRTLPENPEDGGHAWASTIAAASVAVWSIVDIVRLGGVVEAENVRAESRARDVALAPYVWVGGKASAAGVTGRF